MVRSRQRGRRSSLGISLTLANCVCSLFFTSVSSAMRALKARLVLMNCLHSWSANTSKRFCASSRSRMELARMFCECRMLSLLNLAHVSGTEILGKAGERIYQTRRMVGRGAVCGRLGDLCIRGFSALVL